MLNGTNQFIENLKHKPYKTRIRYMWGLTGFCFLLIFGVWIASLKNNFQINKDNLISTDNQEQGADFWDSFSTDIDGLTGDIQDSLGTDQKESFFNGDTNGASSEEALKSDQNSGDTETKNGEASPNLDSQGNEINPQDQADYPALNSPDANQIQELPLGE